MISFLIQIWILKIAYLLWRHRKLPFEESRLSNCQQLLLVMEQFQNL